MSPLHYLRIWLACARYSVVRTMMFRFDFLMWSLVEFFWMAVNVLLVSIIYRHTDSIAGWSKYEMMLLIGTSMLIQRLLMGFFWSNLFELGRNIRSGHFDFFLAQPGNPLFMVSTRKLDLDGILNTTVAIAVIAYSLHQLDVTPSVLDVLAYGALVGCGLLINYGALLLIVSFTFWIIGSHGIEGGYFTLFEFSRLPREAFRGLSSLVFVWLLPVVVVSNVPARALLGDLQLTTILWLIVATTVWLSIGVSVFYRGLRRYSSASS
ncbi:MAG TPA: ABC-2 family transporter protein [Candidatus Synoicihabitans sp.]|nr:ABC-2 family transporter protein [Candidatus Synoicihabitans sp.]